MCPNAYKLSVYFDREFSERQSKSLKKHIQSCQACRSTLYLYEYQRKILSLHSPSVDSSLDHYRKFWNYAEEAKLTRLREPMRITVPLPIAIAAIVLIVSLGALNLVPRNMGRTRELSHTPQVITFSISPNELENLLNRLEELRINSERSSEYTLPLPFVPFGDPLIFRSASVEEEP